MRKIFILLSLLALSSCNSSAKKVPIVYPTLPKQSTQENHLQTNNVSFQDTEKAIDLSEENVVVVSDSSLKQENNDLKSQLQKKDLELERLKQKVYTTNNQVNNSQKKLSAEKNNKKQSEPTLSKTSTTSEKQKSLSLQRSPKTHKDLNAQTSFKEQKKLNMETEKGQNLEMHQSMDSSKTIESAIKSESIESESVKSVEELEPESVKSAEEIESAKKIESKNIIENKRLQKKYYLRLISIRNHEIYEESMKNIVKFLKTEDIIAKYYSLGKYWVVDIIETPEYGTTQAEEFRQKVQTLKYQGQLQFKDAYYTVAKY